MSRSPHNKHQPINSWLVIAPVVGVAVFVFFYILSEQQPSYTIETNPAPITADVDTPDIQPDPLSTPLNTVFEVAQETEDVYCLNAIEDESIWLSIPEFLRGFYYDTETEIEVLLRERITGDVSLVGACQYAEELFYVTRRQRADATFDTYELFTLNTPLESPLSRVAISSDRSVTMHSNFFVTQDTLGLAARTGDASFTAWDYFILDDNLQFTSVESCTRYYDGGFIDIPSGIDPPALVCDYAFNER